MLSTKIDNNKITLNNAEKLVEDIVSETINKGESKNMYNSIADEENIIINSSRTIKARTKMVGIFRQLREIFVRSKTDDETDSDETDDEKPHTTDMPDLEREESAKQRKNIKGKGLKILTPDQMISRLRISLAQLKAGNYSEKLKNEIRQLLYSLYRLKKLSKTVYYNFINTI